MKKSKIHLPYKFCTGSLYEGEWDSFGMNGNGIYILPNGISYEGSVSEGQFHGYGILKYPNGTIIEGEWVNGEGKNLKLTYSDGLEFSENLWNDERFKLSVSNKKRKIPKGCYEMIEGCYDPEYKIILNPENKQFIRIPTKEEENWIIENCWQNTEDN